MWPPQILMYMLPNLHSLRYFFILFHCHLGHIPKTASALSLANSALLEAKRVFIWTRVGTQSYYAVRSRVPRVSTYACAVCMHRAPHQPRANLHLLSEPFMDPGSRQKPKRQLFFSRNSTMTRLGRYPHHYLLPPTFVPLMMIDVGPNGLSRIWPHPLTPKPLFPPPGYFFPSPPRSPFEAYQQVCARLSKDADNTLIHTPRSPPINFLHPSVKFHLPPPP